MEKVYIVLRTSEMIEGCYTTSDGAWEMLRKIEKAYGPETPTHIQGNSLYALIDGVWRVLAYYVRWEVKTGENTA
jgi:hypothetical protein